MIAPIFIIFIFINIWIAWFNNKTRVYRIHVGDPRQINHFVWGALYCTLSGINWFIFHSLYPIGAVLFLHLSVFPVAFNLYAGNPTFYLSKTTTAITDRIMVKIGLKDTEIVNIAAFLISIALLIKSIIG